jgi:hypothetical protein
LSLSSLSRAQLILLALLSAIALSCTWLYLSLAFPPSLQGGGDLRVFLAAAKLLSQHRSPYNGAAISQMAQSLDHAIPKGATSSGFEYLPFIGLALIPMSALSFHAAYILVDLLSIVVIAWSVDRWRAWLAPTLPRWLVVGGALLSAPVAFSLFDGKLDGFMFFGFTICALLYREQKWLALGVLAMLTAMIKPQALFLLPFAYLALGASNRHARARYLVGALGAVALTSAAVCLYDANLWIQWWRYLPSFSSTLDGLQLDSASLAGFAHFLGLSLGLHDPFVWAIFVGGLVFAAAWLWRGFPYQRADNWRDPWLRTVGVTTTVGVAISPFLHNGELILLLPALLWLIDRNQLPAWYLWVMLFLFQTTQLIELTLPVAIQKYLSTSPILTLMVLLASLAAYNWWLGRAQAASSL